MISLTNLSSLHEASAYDMENDYFHGIALEDMGSIDESVFLYDPGDMEILTEGVGSAVWDKIKRAFHAIVKFFKMLGGKIKSFVSGFFKKAEDEVKKAEKGESSGESEDGKPPMPKEEEQKLEDLEKKVEQKEEEVKTATAEKAEEIREEIAEHKEEISEIKRKYSRSKKYKKTFMNKDDAVVVELYHTGGFSTNLGIRNAAIDALFAASGSYKGKDYETFKNAIMTSDFADMIDMAQELAEEQPKTSEKWQAYLSRQSQRVLDLGRKIISAKVDYDDFSVLQNLGFRKINDKYRSGFLGFKKERFKKDQVISEIRKLIADAKKFMNEFTADCKEAEGTFNKIIQDLNGYQKDESKSAYAEVFKIQAQCCNKAIGVVNKMSSMHAASIREAIQYDINVLHKFQ